MPASLRQSLKDDCQVVDDTQTVTFLAKSEPIGNQTNIIPFAWHEELDLTQVAASGGYLNVGDIMWTLFDVYLNGRKPESGDTITDEDNVEYVIIQATRDDLRQAWECVTRKAKLKG